MGWKRVEGGGGDDPRYQVWCEYTVRNNTVKYCPPPERGGRTAGAGGGVARPLAGCGEERELCNGPNVGGCCVCAKPF